MLQALRDLKAAKEEDLLSDEQYEKQRAALQHAPAPVLALSPRESARDERGPCKLQSEHQSTLYKSCKRGGACARTGVCVSTYS